MRGSSCLASCASRRGERGQPAEARHAGRTPRRGAGTENGTQARTGSGASISRTCKEKWCSLHHSTLSAARHAPCRPSQDSHSRRESRLSASGSGSHNEYRVFPSYRFVTRLRPPSHKCRETKTNRTGILSARTISAHRQVPHIVSKAGGNQCEGCSRHTEQSNTCQLRTREVLHFRSCPIQNCTNLCCAPRAPASTLDESRQRSVPERQDSASPGSH